MAYSVSNNYGINSNYKNAQTVSELFPSTPIENTNKVFLIGIGPTSQVFQPVIDQPVQVVALNLLGPTSVVNQPTVTQTLDGTVRLGAWVPSSVVFAPVVINAVPKIILNRIENPPVFHPINVTVEGGTVDTSDILTHYRRREEEANRIYEENIAAQILKKRRYDEEQKRKKKKKKLTPQQKFEVLVQQVAPEFRNTKQKRIKALLLVATMDD